MDSFWMEVALGLSAVAIIGGVGWLAYLIGGEKRNEPRHKERPGYSSPPTDAGD